MIPRRWAFTLPGEFDALSGACAPGEAHDDAPIASFERAVAAYVGVSHAAAVNSGRHGMSLVLGRLNLQPGDEVVVPAYTLADLIPLIEKSGAKPVPADIDPETLNVTAATLERCLSPRTRAVLVLHAFGNPAPMREICAWARSRALYVIEDAAHALGARIDGERVGAFGDAAFFSFEPTKPINTYGGGMVVSRDVELIAAIRADGAVKPYDLPTLARKAQATRQEQFLMGNGLALPLLHVTSYPAGKALISRLYRQAQSVPSSQCRYTPLQAALGERKLRGLDERLAARERNAAHLRGLLREDIRTQQVLPGAHSTHYFFIVTLPVPAARVRRKLLWRGIDTAVGDEVADHCGRLLGRRDTPNLDQVYNRTMALPFFDGIDDAALERVARALNRSC